MKSYTLFVLSREKLYNLIIKLLIIGLRKTKLIYKRKYKDVKILNKLHNITSK